MKLRNIFFILSLLCSTVVFASEGAEGGGGGDNCESRIQEIRDDIVSWIRRGGAESLTLPAGVQASKYDKDMIAAARKAKVVCVSRSDAGYPVQVYGTPKVCRFDRMKDRATITCDRAKFLSADEDSQYALIHHELAGVAGVEKPVFDKSNYQISKQIAAFLEDTVVRKLAVKPALKPSALTANDQHVVARIKQLFDSNKAIFNSYYAPACTAMKQSCEPNDFSTQACKQVFAEVERRGKALVDAQNEADSVLNSGDHNAAFNILHRYFLGIAGLRQLAFGYFDHCDLN